MARTKKNFRPSLENTGSSFCTSSKIKGCISVNWLYLELLSTPTPCKIISQQNRKCSLTANKEPTENWREPWALLLLALGKAETFQLWEDRQQVSSLAVKSIPICKAKVHMYSWVLRALGAFRIGVTNPVYPAGRTSLFLSWRKHNWTASSWYLCLLSHKCLSHWIMKKRMSCRTPFDTELLGECGDWLLLGDWNFQRKKVLERN